MMRSVIVVMSLMGSSVFILYLLLKPLLKKFFSAKTRMWFIIVSTAFYLLPFPILKNYYYNVLNRAFGINFYEGKGFYSIKSPIRILPNNSVMLSKANVFALAVTFALAAVFVAAMLINYKGYRRLRQQIFLASQPIRDTEIIKDGLQKNMQKANIRFSDKYEPLTIGFFNPIILLPNSCAHSKSIRFILKHELAHLRNRDFLVETLMYAVICLHWFNIFAYIMFFEAKQLMEYCADEVCVLDMDKWETEAYIETVIAFSEKKETTEDRLVNCFGSNDYKKLKSRIIEIKNVKRHNTINFILSCTLITVSVLSCSMLAFAYENTPVYYDNDVNPNADTFFVTDNAEDKFAEENIIDFGDNIYSTVFVDDDGNICEVKPKTNSQQNNCNHTYVSGQAWEHTALDDNGCILKTYNARQCSKCGAITKESLLSTATYNPCPH